MGKVRISALPDGGKLQNNELLVGNRNGITYKFSAWLMPGLNTPYIITAAYADTTVEQNILLLQGGTAQQITLPEPSMFPPQFMNNTAIKIYNQGSNAALLFAQSPTFQWQEYGIVGNIDNPPTYALNSTHIPTLTNASIVANKVVASANAASATTWSYSTGAVTQIIPYTVFTPTVLNIDPSSTDGNIKINYTTNNLLQVGSKVLVTDGGVTTEQTIVAGSQSGGVPSWASQTFPAVSLLQRKLRYLNGLFISPSRNNPGVILTSPDGVTWTSVNIGLTGFISCEDIAYDGMTWVVVGLNIGTGLPFIMTSTDLTTWTSRTPTGITAIITTVIYGNGLFVAGAGGGQLSTSPDGITWTARTSNTGGRSIQDISYDGSGLFILIASDGGGGTICKSTNGTTWTTVSQSLGYSDFLCVRFGNGVWVLGASGNGLATSPDGDTWTGQTSPFNLATRGMAYGNGIFTICGRSDIGNSYFNIATSATAASGSWSSINVGGNINLIGVANGNNIWVTSSDTGSGLIYKKNALASYQFTITSPSLPVPDAMYLGGKSLSYSVSTTITPSYTNATLTYTDNAGVITATGAQDVATGNNVMLKFEGMNSGESMQEIGAALYIRSQEGIILPQNKVMTLTPYKSQYEVDAYYYLIDIADTP